MLGREQEPQKNTVIQTITNNLLDDFEDHFEWNRPEAQNQNNTKAVKVEKGSATAYQTPEKALGHHLNSEGESGKFIQNTKGAGVLDNEDEDRTYLQKLHESSALGKSAGKPHAISRETSSKNLI